MLIEILLFALLSAALLCLGFLFGFWVRPDVDKALHERRLRHRAASLLQQPFPRDYRDEFNELRNSIPVADDELHRAKPICQPR